MKLSLLPSAMVLNLNQGRQTDCTLLVQDDRHLKVKSNRVVHLKVKMSQSAFMISYYKQTTYES